MKWVAMFPGVSGARGEGREVARALEAAGPLSEAGRLQVATYGASLAGFRTLGAEPAAIVEHSMGIYAALTAAGVWSFEDGARVAGEASRCLDASPDGGVAVSVGLSRDRVEALAQAAGAWIANDNSELQLAVGGSPAAVDVFEAASRAAGAFDVVRVPLRGAVHTPLMASASRRLASFLDDIPMVAPRIPLLNHVDAAWHECAEVLRSLVSDALRLPVRWRSCVERLLREDYGPFVDVGPGDVLAKLVKWVRRDARTASAAIDPDGARRAIGGA